MGDKSVILLGAKILGMAVITILATASALWASGVEPVDALFNSDPLSDVDLDLYCSQFGPTFGIEAFGEHLFDLRCVDDEGEVLNIDVKAACQQQYGPDATVVAVGGRVTDWRCVRWRTARHYVVPVLVVASDYFFSPADIDAGLENLRRVLGEVQNWYRRSTRPRSTFTLLQPIVELSLRSANDWHRLSCITAEPADRPSACSAFSGATDRFGYFEAGRREVADLYTPATGAAEIVFTVLVFTGAESDAFTLGAAANVDGAVEVNIQAPEVAACNASRRFCGTYPVGHEMGHNFGLNHPCDRAMPPRRCHRSIMQTASPPGAVLLRDEQVTLSTSAFFP